MSLADSIKDAMAEAMLDEDIHRQGGATHEALAGRALDAALQVLGLRLSDQFRMWQPFRETSLLRSEPRSYYQGRVDQIQDLFMLLGLDTMPDEHADLCGRCYACWNGLPINFMIVCPGCGNKRCPKANDHRNECTGSNEPGQEGSAYPAVGITPGGNPVCLVCGIWYGPGQGNAGVCDRCIEDTIE